MADSKIDLLVCPFFGDSDLGVMTSVRGPSLCWVECFTCGAKGTTTDDSSRSVKCWNTRSKAIGKEDHD